MIKPLRLQRSRVKGYKMVHENGLPNYFVGRPGPFGNPYKLEGDIIYVDASNRRQLLDKWIYLCPGDTNLVQSLYRATITGDFSKVTADLSQGMFDVKYWTKKFENINWNELKGKNLYCFCPLCDENGNKFPCHADVLLELANREI